MIKGSAWEHEHPLISEAIEQAFATLTRQPEYLLMGDGGRRDTADIIAARLYGFDEQVDAEWYLPEVRDCLLRPLRSHGSYMAASAAEIPTGRLRTAEYRQQSWWSTTRIDAELLMARATPSGHVMSMLDNPRREITIAAVVYARRA